MLKDQRNILQYRDDFKDMLRKLYNTSMWSKCECLNPDLFYCNKCIADEALREAKRVGGAIDES